MYLLPSRVLSRGRNRTGPLNKCPECLYHDHCLPCRVYFLLKIPTKMLFTGSIFSFRNIYAHRYIIAEKVDV